LLSGLLDEEAQLPVRALVGETEEIAKGDIHRAELDVSAAKSVVCSRERVALALNACKPTLKCLQRLRRAAVR
jgi:hypothetical protein